MFSLIRTLIMVAVLFGLVALGLGFMTPDRQSKLGTQLAGLAVKGCRGGQVLYDAFKEEWDKLKPEGIGSEEAAHEQVASAEVSEPEDARPVR